MADLKIVLVGDVNVCRSNPDSAFLPVRHLLQDADVRFCNLETMVADAKYVSPYIHNPVFPLLPPRTDELTFGAYARAGFDVMNQANNPNTYFGHEPLLRSFEILDAEGIIHAGAGRNLAEARKPAIIERKGIKVAFVCRTSVGIPEMAATMDMPGVAFYPIHTSYEAPVRVHSNPGLPPIVHTTPDRGQPWSALENDINGARKQADIVIVSWHWGLSPFQVQPHAGAGDVGLMDYQKELGHFAIDCGADMVVGHHSHEPQPIEVYKRKPILYSLANFVHDGEIFRDSKLMAILVRCLIRSGKIHELSYVPGKIIGNGPPDFAPPSQLTQVVNRMREMSSPFGTRFEVRKDDVAVVL
jgi:poly-gamma-glutamate capsule biosynthesis protein CapA/YwtB (metallophosphatase superfamily)